MIFLAVLLAASLTAWLIPAHGYRRTVRETARLAMAAAFVVAGVSHFLMPTPFVQHLPTWVPARHALIYLTGALEIAGGFGLLLDQPWRRLVAILVALYLLAVFPANLYVAVADVAVDSQPGGLYPWLRLPFQALFIAWVLWSASALPADRRLADGRMRTAPVTR